MEKKMETHLDRKRIIIFLAFAFGIAWALALVIFFTGGLVNSPSLGIPGLTLAYLLLAVGYMGAPTIANVLTRLVTREGWGNAWLHPKFKKGWKYWLAAWFLPPIFVLMGMAFFFLFYPRFFDPDLVQVQLMLSGASAAGAGGLAQINPWLIFLFYGLQAAIIAPVVNALFTFGEEFGWRAYLLQKLMPLGGRKAALILGVIWGVWHWPVIAMGHNYGLEYTGFPWLGMLAMTWFTIVLGTFMAWLVLRAGSVWPAVIAHGAINGIAGLALLAMRGDPPMVLGPSAAGLLGSIGFSLAALWIFLASNALKVKEEPVFLVKPAIAGVEEK
jgi:membrane protease YdiL (CAAX protease family)